MIGLALIHAEPSYLHVQSQVPCCASSKMYSDSGSSTLSCFHQREWRRVSGTGLMHENTAQSSSGGCPCVVAESSQPVCSQLLHGFGFRCPVTTAKLATVGFARYGVQCTSSCISGAMCLFNGNELVHPLFSTGSRVQQKRGWRSASTGSATVNSRKPRVPATRSLAPGA